MVRVAGQRVGQAVVADIYENVQIHSTHRIINDTLRFPGSKARYFGIYEIRGAGIRLQQRTFQMLMLALLTPLYNVGINLFAQGSTALQSDDSEFSQRNSFKVTFICWLK
jgi:hypothetical protein